MLQLINKMISGFLAFTSFWMVYKVKDWLGCLTGNLTRGKIERTWI